MSLGARIKELRLKKGASLQAVADAVGASKPHIWELERGTTKNPSLDLITKLANYFRVSVDYLAGTGNRRPRTMPNPNDAEEIGDEITAALAPFNITVTRITMTFEQEHGCTHIGIDARRDHDSAPKRQPIVPLYGCRTSPDSAA